MNKEIGSSVRKILELKKNKNLLLYSSNEEIYAFLEFNLMRQFYESPPNKEKLFRFIENLRNKSLYENITYYSYIESRSIILPFTRIRLFYKKTDKDKYRLNILRNINSPYLRNEFLQDLSKKQIIEILRKFAKNERETIEELKKELEKKGA